MAIKTDQIQATCDNALVALEQHYKQVSAGYGDTEALVSMVNILVAVTPDRYIPFLESIIKKQANEKR